MKTLVASLLITLASAVAAAPPERAAAAPAPAVPGDSLYQIKAALTDQGGAPLALDAGRGRPVLVTMFYGSCPHVCPLIIASIQRMERDLPAGQRQKLRVLLISLDPDRDSPAKLTEVARQHDADLSRWTFARTDKRSVRRIAAALNVQYRRLPDGTINHSAVISLLDADGRIVRQTSSILRPDTEFNATLQRWTAR